jgi:hypothetical protein
MSSMTKETDAFVNRASYWLTILGVALLVREITKSIYARINDGGPFAASAHFSGTDGYRVIAIVAFVSACGLAYSLGKIGRVMALFLGVIILWETSMWYAVYSSFGVGLSTETFTMLTVGLLTVGFLLVYMPYTLLRGFGRIHHEAR